MHMFFSEPPYFLREPDDVVAVAGTDTMLDCQVWLMVLIAQMENKFVVTEEVVNLRQFDRGMW